MDKLEHDARIARLEGRVQVHTALFVIGGLIFASMLFFTLHWASESSSIPATPMPTPVIPPPTATMTVGGFAPTEGLMGFAIPAEGSMDALSHQLTTFRDLLHRGLISEDEWQAKKDQLLSKPVSASDMRSGLEQVQQLWNQKVICENERDELRAKLLGIEK